MRIRCRLNREPVQIRSVVRLLLNNASTITFRLVVVQSRINNSASIRRVTRKHNGPREWIITKKIGIETITTEWTEEEAVASMPLREQSVSQIFSVSRLKNSEIDRQSVALPIWFHSPSVPEIQDTRCVIWFKGVIISFSKRNLQHGQRRSNIFTKEEDITSGTFEWLYSPVRESVQRTIRINNLMLSPH